MLARYWMLTDIGPRGGMIGTRMKMKARRETSLPGARCERAGSRTTVGDREHFKTSYIQMLKASIDHLLAMHQML
jgi:hypothetical protein